MFIRRCYLRLSIALFALATIAGPARADDPFLVKPYVQIGEKPTSSQMQVLWHAADADEDWQLERQAKDGSWKREAAPTMRRVAVSGIAPHRVYQATLTDLTAGEKVAYRVLAAGKPLFSGETQGLKTANQSSRYVIMGDCGAGSNEQKPIARRIFESKPDMVVITGDIVYSSGRISEYRDRFWPIYNADTPSDRGAPLIRSIPFVGAPGNHDTESRDLDRFPDALAYFLYWNQPRNGPAGRVGGPFFPTLKGSETNQKAFLSAAGSAFPNMANFSFDVANVHWTILDSNSYTDWTSDELKNWVAADLAAAKSADWRFVAFHHPGFNSSKAHFEQQHMRLLAPIFEAGKVDVVYAGHVHNYQRSFPLTFVPDAQGKVAPRGRLVAGKWNLDKTFDGKSDTTPNGVIYLVTGAGGQKLYNPEQQDDRPSWQEFTTKFISKVHSFTLTDIDAKTATIRQLTADGTELDRIVITK